MALAIKAIISKRQNSYKQLASKGLIYYKKSYNLSKLCQGEIVKMSLRTHKKKENYKVY